MNINISLPDLHNLVTDPENCRGGWVGEIQPRFVPFSQPFPPKKGMSENHKNGTMTFCFDLYVF